MVQFLWFIPFAISSVIFTNHYNRDAVGALEKQLESDIPISVVQYALLNTIYFTPNIISPLCAGLVIKPLGGTAKVFVIFTVFAALGSMLFAIGVQSSLVSVMCAGRFISGVMYESIDTLPVILLRPLFAHRRWNFVVGMTNASLRLGSVLNFYISPLSYRLLGLSGSFWIATVVAVIGVIASASTLFFITKVKESEDSSEQPLEADDKVKQSHNSELESSQQQENNGDIEMSGNKRNSRNLNGGRSNSTDTNGKDHYSESNNNSDKGIYSHLTGAVMAVVEHIRETVPLHKFSFSFYLYFVTVACVYGAMVPFWFLGSKFLQDNYGLSVEVADALILLPEGCIVLVSPTLGLAIDYYKPDVIYKFLFLALSSFSVPMCYVMLIFGFRQHSTSSAEGGDMDVHSEWLINPVVVMVILGISYACTNCMVWSCITHVLAPEHFDINSILISCGMNILPSILPPLSVCSLFRRHDVFSKDDATRALCLLIISGVLSSLCALVSACSNSVDYAAAVDDPKATNGKSGHGKYAEVSNRSEHGDSSSTSNPMFVIDDNDGDDDGDADVEVNVEGTNGRDHVREVVEERS